jgi:hypothetical protein
MGRPRRHRHQNPHPAGTRPVRPLYGMLTDRYGVTWIVGADTAPDSN